MGLLGRVPWSLNCGYYTIILLQLWNRTCYSTVHGPSMEAPSNKLQVVIHHMWWSSPKSNSKIQHQKQSFLGKLYSIMAWNWHEWIPLSVLSTVEVFSSTILHIFTLGDPTTFFGVKRSKKDAHVHQKGTRLNGKRDVPRSETMGLRAPRFQILAPEGPLARGPEAQCQRTSGKKVPRPRAPRFWWLARGAPRGHRAEFRAPGTFLKKIPLAIYLNGFGLAVSWTRFARVGSSLNWNICLEGTPSAGRKSLVTVRPCLGVKRSKKGARVHQKGTRLNGKRDVPHSETISLRAPRFEIMASQGPLFHVSEARSHRTSGKEAPVWNLVITRKALSVYETKRAEREILCRRPPISPSP